MPRTRGEEGQAAVELVALLPVVVLIALGLWQGVVAGQALWLAGGAAREAARARAVGADAEAAARRVLPRTLRDGVAVRRDGDGVHVRITVPAIVGGLGLGSVGARARMAPQA